MLNKLTYLIVLPAFLLFGACQSKSGQLNKPGGTPVPSINQWVGNLNEDQSGSTDIKADSLQMMPDSGTPGISETGTPSIPALTAPPYTETMDSGGIIEGKVISIIDGDTFDLLNDSNKTYRIRMEGIDAPE